ncbi:protein singles bar [Chrysoperla carnea]|uniref:protein singles bar n=1 Tax=Chrysoperla carnea TaxID=189513 RepID=UPI001D066FD7|nr:protein singles bar [Chrysoperla carnea]
MAGRARPHIINMNGGGGFGPNNNYGGSGINVCCCTCCTCIHFRFLKTTPGVMKIVEILLASFCQSVLLEYGMEYSGTIGASYFGFLTTASSCMMTATILLGCYIVSEKSYNLIRQSLFETAFNAVAAITYFSASSYLAFAVKTFLLHLNVMRHQAYPAMSLVYGLGTVLGILHAFDAYQSYRFFMGYR